MINQWFISIDDPQIKIRSHFKKQFRNISQDFAQESHDSFSENNDNLFKLFKQAQSQYSKEDDKWTMSLSNFFKERAIEYERQRQFKEAREDSLDELNLLDVQRDKYKRLNNKDEGVLKTLKKCGDRIKDCQYRIYRAIGCVILQRDVDSTFEAFNANLTSELKKINLPFKEDAKLVFIDCLGYFSDIIITKTYLDYINDFKISDTNRLFLAQEKFLIDRKKVLRKKVFEEFNGEGVIKKDVLAELCKCTEQLSNVLRLLRKEEEALSEQAEFYKYGAYNSDDIESIKINFDEAVTILERLSKQNHNYERELIFTKARKSEFLSTRYDDLHKKCQYLQEAKKYYGSLHDPRRLLAKVLYSFYKIKRLIVEENDFNAAIDHAASISYDKEDIRNRFPGVEDIVRICELLSFFPLNQSDIHSIDQLYKLRPDDKNSFLRPLWGIVYSHHILRHSISLNADLDSFFRSSTVEFLKSGKIEESIKNMINAGDAEKQSKEIIQYLQQEESQQLEFKGSFCLDVKGFLFSEKKNTTSKRDIETSALKTIVAFLNSSGGNLILGVLEDREDIKKFNLPKVGNKLIFGVDREFGNSGIDKYKLKIQDLMRERIDKNLPSLVRIEQHPFKGHYIVQIEIPEGREWYYLDNKEFYVREVNRTVERTGKDIDKYRELKPRK